MNSESLSKIRRESESRERKRLVSKLIMYSRITGFFMMLCGVFQMTIGLISLGIGTVGGILLFLAGYTFYQISKYSKQAQLEKGVSEEDIFEIIRYLVAYLRYQCWSMVIVFTLLIICIVGTLYVLSNWSGVIGFSELGEHANHLFEKWSWILQTLHLTGTTTIPEKLTL